MPTTIQATGKRYKGQMLAATLLVAAGVVMIVVAQGDDGRLLWGAGVAAAGLAWYAVARLRAWWHHG